MKGYITCEIPLFCVSVLEIQVINKMTASKSSIIGKKFKTVQKTSNFLLWRGSITVIVVVRYTVTTAKRKNKN